MNKRAFIVLSVLFAVGLGYAGQRWRAVSLAGRVHALNAPIKLYGNVDIRQVELGFRLPGRLLELRAEEGEVVRAGTMLARLDARPYEDVVRAAEAEVARQTAHLEKLQVGARRSEVAQAEARVKEAEAELERAHRDFARQNDLVRLGAANRVTLEHAESAVAVANAHVDIATQAYELVRQGTRSEEISEARAALSVAQAAQAAAQTSLADTLMTAPSDGVILSRVREVGGIVGPNNIVYILSLTKPIAVRAYVSEPLLGRIHPGLRVEVFSDSRPNKSYHGHVGFISPVAEFTPKTVETPDLRTDLVYRLRIVVQDDDEGLRQGMPVSVLLPLNDGG